VVYHCQTHSAANGGVHRDGLAVCEGRAQLADSVTYLATPCISRPPAARMITRFQTIRPAYQ